MKEVGLAPIFYGRVLSGPVMPSLMYMVRRTWRAKKHWAGFSAAPVGNIASRPSVQGQNDPRPVTVMLKRTAALDRFESHALAFPFSWRQVSLQPAQYPLPVFGHFRTPPRCDR